MIDKTMTETKESIFRYDNIEIHLKNDITYHDHLYRIQKAVWVSVIDELECGRLDGGVWNAVNNMHLLEIGERALDAIVTLGYDKERMSLAIDQWLLEMVHDAFLSTRYPEIYGRVRYAKGWALVAE